MKLVRVQHRTAASAAVRRVSHAPKIYKAAGFGSKLQFQPSAPSKILKCSVAAQDTLSAATALQPINLSDKALSHLTKLRSEAGGESLLLRVGVKQGGCSGMSYQMDFESMENISADDTIMEYDAGAFKIVCDPKSLLYLFGMQLDYSDALIGGGFQFQNPNASQSCGCGKSFGV